MPAKQSPRTRAPWVLWFRTFSLGVVSSLIGTVIFEVLSAQRIAHIIPWLNGPGQIVAMVQHAENRAPLEPGELSRLQSVDTKTGKTYGFDIDEYSSATLPPGEYRVEAFIDGMFGGSSNTQVDGRIEARPVIIAFDQAQLKIEVHHKNGRPLIGATVEIFSPRRAWPWRTGTTNDRGVAINSYGDRFSLNPTTKDDEGYIVRVSLNSQVLATKSPVRLSQGNHESLSLVID